MNDVVYWLCGKPVAGFLMLVSGFCVVHPPIDEAAVSLRARGTVLKEVRGDAGSFVGCFMSPLGHRPEEVKGIDSILVKV